MPASYNYALSEQQQQTYQQVSGHSVHNLHYDISLLAGGAIILFAAIVIAVATWQLNNKEEITMVTFLMILFFTLGFASVFLLFILV